MSTFSVPVVTVKTVTKHPNADALDIITFEEIAWVCVDKRDARKPGDLVVYIPIDSVVDTSRPEFAFLAPKAKSDGTFRIRTIRLRGEISQGLIITAPKEVDYDGGIIGVNPVDAVPGADAAFHYGIIKYEPPPESIPPQSAGSYPTWCEKSDAERYQNFNRSLEPYLDDLFYKSLKMDGTSLTVFYDATRTENPVGVCSRNWEIKEFDEGANKWTTPSERPQATNIYWAAARKYQLIELVETIAKELGLTHFAIQGEICGPGIQGNKMGLPEQQFFAFDMYDGVKHDFLPYDNFLKICSDHHLQTVRVLEVSTIRKEVETKFEDIKSLKYSNGNPAEGVVYVASIPRRIGTLGRLKFKYINPEFLLKYE